MKPFPTRPASKISGTIRVASDKSISHRSLIFASLAEGESRIRHLLTGEDVLNTLTILNQLGVKTSHSAQTLTQDSELVVQGVGVTGFKAPQDVLYCGNSGTTMRLMLGLLAGQNFKSTLTGDASLNKRPMERVFKPLREMGADFQVEDKNGVRLIHVLPAKKGLQGIRYDSPVASAQVKSSIFLAGLRARGETVVSEPAKSRDHTELMLSSMGANFQIEENTVRMTPVHKFNPIRVSVPADISSAAFFIVAALIVPNSKLTLTDVNLNPTRTGIFDVLQKMGANIEITNKRELLGEPQADLIVSSSRLKNVDVSGDVIPRLIDEIPILALAGACATGTLVVRDAKELRVKESDRIVAIVRELGKLGVIIREREDGFEIDGFGSLDRFQQPSAPFQSNMDHRLAMMAMIAGLLLKKPAEIDDVECVKTSFPEFFELLERVS